jgi:gas vesicle protein
MTYHELPTSPSNRDDGGHFLVGLIAGAAVGGGLALLFAPRQGADMRHDLASGAQQAGRRISQAYDSVAGTARRNARRFVGYAGGRSSKAHDDTFTPLPGEVSTFGASSSTSTTPSEPFDRGDDPSRVLRDAIGEATYQPAPVAPAETGPGATSPAPPADDKSPLA